VQHEERFPSAAAVCFPPGSGFAGLLNGFCDGHPRCKGINRNKQLMVLQLFGNPDADQALD
jgi:hypothetical protein